jgi:hypothetical protein
LASSAVLNMQTATIMLTPKHDLPWTDEEPQTNAKNAYVCATRFSRRYVISPFGGALALQLIGSIVHLDCGIGPTCNQIGRVDSQFRQLGAHVWNERGACEQCAITILPSVDVKPSANGD